MELRSIILPFILTYSLTVFRGECVKQLDDTTPQASQVYQILDQSHAVVDRKGLPHPLSSTLSVRSLRRTSRTFKTIMKSSSVSLDTNPSKILQYNKSFQIVEDNKLIAIKTTNQCSIIFCFFHKEARMLRGCQTENEIMTVLATCTLLSSKSQHLKTRTGKAENTDMENINWQAMIVSVINVTVVRYMNHILYFSCNKLMRCISISFFSLYG